MESQRKQLRIIVSMDLFISIFALALSILIWAFASVPVETWDDLRNFIISRVPSWYYLLPLVWPILLADTYDQNFFKDWKHNLSSVLKSLILGIVIYLFFYFIFTSPGEYLLPRRGIASFFVIAYICSSLLRIMFIAGKNNTRILLLGGGRFGQSFLDIISNLKSLKFEVIGIIDDDVDKLGAQLNGYTIIGTTSQLKEIAAQKNVSTIIVSITNEIMTDSLEQLTKNFLDGLNILWVSDLYEDSLGRILLRNQNSGNLARLIIGHSEKSTFYEIAKRIVDIVVSLVGIFILVLVTPFIALAIFYDGGKPIFYTQERIGMRGKKFRVIKFRTMMTQSNPNEAPVITKIGKFLRKTRLDEWPQFINVLLGDISVVGPRPEQDDIAKELGKKVPFYTSRLLVKPGITGWAQVNYKYPDPNNIEDLVIKNEYDIYYVIHRNLFLDFLVMSRTIWTMLNLRGSSIFNPNLKEVCALLQKIMQSW